ncbi:hypothetical protein [Psychroflexus tropicus]|uniref:hypothetical protein n=1 Tax=Psychroflexus tropicus TaxID=197345 RepID=UPI0003688CAD|nr:hypothetical protein [Psychroflexus tropicus]
MKFLKSIAVILALTLVWSCSSDDSDSNPSLADLPKSNLEIKAVASGSANTSSSAKAIADVEVSEFLINITNIEFEFADGFGVPGNSSGNSDDDDNLNFEDLPEEIVSYLEENYPNDPFCKGELEDGDDDDPYVYEIELQSGTEIYFREDFSVYATETDDDGCDDNGNDNSDDDRYDSEDEFELRGPFELNLSQDEVTVVEVEIPVGEYDEVEFEMERSNDPTSELYQKSILMRGTISGTAFEFFHTLEEDFEVDYEDQVQNLIITEDNNNSIVFDFDLVAVFNQVDLSGASDGNGNGTIEISPEDNDGNRQLANRIKNAIEQYVDLLDD